jgi:hypothetical protein
MKNKAMAIRPFIGAKDFNTSRCFYNEVGFSEVVLNPKLSLFTWQELGFYLQNAYVKEWIDNTMLFFQVEDVNLLWKELFNLELHKKYSGVKLIPIRVESWGRECFLHDPSGVLLHFGEFF